MLIREWLQRMPPDTSARYAAAAPWREAVPEPGGWRLAAADPQAAARAAAALSVEAVEALKLLLLRYGSRPFERGQLEEAAEASGLSGAAAGRGLDELRAAGILFTFRKVWGDRLHVLASDAMAAWLPAMFPIGVIPLDGGRRAARPVQPFIAPLSLQLLQTLAELGMRGFMHGLEISAKGGLSGRAAAAAASRLAFGPEALQPFDAQFASRSAAGDLPQLALCLDAALRLGLLKQAAGQYNWRPETFAAWLASDPGMRERELLDIVTDMLAASDRRYMHAAALLRILEGGIWYPAGRIDEWFAKHVPEAKAHWRTWVETLAAFGWMQRGMAEGGETAIRWTIDPQARTSGRSPSVSGGLRFLPGGELVLPPDLDYRHRWELELLADVAGTPGPMTGMRMTAKSFARWSEGGRTAEDAIGLLAACAGGAVPEEMIRLLREWEETAGRIGFREALLLECDNADLADRAAADPSIAELLGERLGGRHFLVERRHASELRRRLDKAGIPARSGLAGPDEPKCGRFPSAFRDPVPAAGEDESADWLPPSSPLKLYAPDLDNLPVPAQSTSVTTLSPPPSARPPDNQRAGSGRARSRGTAGLPRHWFSGLRSVHPSTRREMVKRAIEIGAAVRIVRDGAALDIVPERLEETTDGWRMHGRLNGPDGTSGSDAGRVRPDRIVLDNGSWTAMQLLLPEEGGNWK